MNARLALVLALCAATAGCDDSTGTPPGGSLLWGRRFGKTTTTEPVVVAADREGNAVVGGRFFATTDFGGGPVTSPADNWQAFVAKYTGGGDLLWMRSLGDIFEEKLTAVAFDGHGNVYAAGSFRGTIDFGGGPLQSQPSDWDIFLAKLAPDGSHLWSKRFGSTSDDFVHGMAANAHGDVIVQCYVAGAADFGDGVTTPGTQEVIVKLDPAGTITYLLNAEWLGVLDDNTLPSAFGIDSAGAFVAVTSDSAEAGTETLHLFKLDPAGGLAWQRLLASSSVIRVNALALGDDGSIFVTGRVGHPADFGGIESSGRRTEAFVAATKPDGTPRWVRRFTFRHNEDDTGSGIYSTLYTNAIAAAGWEVVVTGGYFGWVDFGGGLRQSAGVYDSDLSPDDLFAVRLDAGGGYLWDREFGNKRQQAGTSVSVSPSGETFVAGWANGTLPFGDSAGAPYNDAFLIKLAR